MACPEVKIILEEREHVVFLHALVDKYCVWFGRFWVAHNIDKAYVYIENEKDLGEIILPNVILHALSRCLGRMSSCGL